MNEEFQIYLKSRQGNAIYNSPSVVEFNFINNPKVIDQSELFSICVKSAAIKVTWYNVNSYNNLIVINNHHYTLTPSNYNVYSLATALTALLTPEDITVEYNDTLNTFVLTGTGSFHISSDTSMDEVVGLDFSEADTIYSSANIITGTLIADLSYTSTIYITSPDLLNNSKDSSTITALSDVLASINVTVNSLGIIFYEGNARTHLFRKIIDKFTIILKMNSIKCFK